MRIVAALTLVALVAGCAHNPGAGSYADAATTYVALSGGGFEEANPLLATGDPLTTALASLGAKQGAKYALTWAGLPACESHRGVEAVGWAGFGWNLPLLVVSSSLSWPVTLATGGAAAALYLNSGDCNG